MAMLAEKRSKQKWSTDPRNTAWSKDTSRYGYQMLEKMGWQSGKGLGSKLHGGTAHVKVSKKNNSLGLGADKYHDDNWLAHQEDFNDLLAKLNGIAENGDSASTTASAHETEKKARGSKKRVFYQRFVKSKDLSGYSAEDMACIMGQRSKSAPATPIEQSEDEDSDDSCASCPVTSDPLHCSLSGLMTVNAKESVHDYFAKKMAEMKARRASGNSGQTPTPAQEKDMMDVESENKVKGEREKSGKRKKKNRESEKINNDDKSSQLDEDDTTCDKYGISVGDNEKSSKKEKKKNKKGLVEVASSNSECDSVISSKKKKKSKDKKNRASESNGSDGSAATVETKQDSDCDSEEPPKKKKRKDKDRQEEQESDQQETNLITKKKKRKQEESNIEFENSQQTDSSTKSKKRDKKRKNRSVKDSDSLDDAKETKAKKKKSRK